jgi:hypothetical protein
VRIMWVQSPTIRMALNVADPWPTSSEQFSHNFPRVLIRLSSLVQPMSNSAVSAKQLNQLSQSTIAVRVEGRRNVKPRSSLTNLTPAGLNVLTVRERGAVVGFVFFRIAGTRSIETFAVSWLVCVFRGSTSSVVQHFTSKLLVTRFRRKGFCTFTS